MADPINLAALGVAVTAGAKVLWDALKKSDTKKDAAKDAMIVELKADKAVLQAENTRLDGVVKDLGEKLDAKRDEIYRLLLKTAGVVARNRSDPQRSAEFEEEYPTAVKLMADIIAPISSNPPDLTLPKPDPLPELEGWDAYRKTPPAEKDEPEPTQPRKRLPSRPR